MLSKSMIFIVITLVSVAIFAFPPWITKEFATTRAITSFQDSQRDIEDGCGFNCNGCSVIQSKKVMFGYRVEMEYACGLVKKDLKEKHKTRSVFVSFIGTVH